MQHYKQGLVKSFATRCGITGLSRDIFGRLNELNLSLQGHDKTIINFINVLSAFQTKLESWERKMTASRTKIFHPLNEFFLMTRRTCSMMTMTKIIDELQLLRCELAKHFPDISRDDLACVRNSIWSQVQTLSAFSMELLITLINS